MPNLLGLWAKLLRHAGDRITADMRTQGVPTARTFQGLSQPMMVVMGCLERYSAHPQLAHIAGGVLALTLRVLEVGSGAGSRGCGLGVGLAAAVPSHEIFSVMIAAC